MSQGFQPSNGVDGEESSSSLRIPGANGLRAIACLLVLGHHLFQRFNPEESNTFLKALHFFWIRGEAGVSMFFVLSGCLLSLPFWQAFSSGKPFPSIKRYARLRAIRIVPAFWINLVICAVVSVVIFGMEFDFKKLITALLFLNNYHYSTFFPSEINGPLWSIGLEVSCYILMPVVLLTIYRRTSTLRAASTLLTLWIILLQLLNPLIISFFMTENKNKGWEFGIDGGAKQWLPYWNTATFLTQFLLGSLAALIIVWLGRKAIRKSFYFDAIALLLFLSAFAMLMFRLTPGSPDALSKQPYVSPFFATIIAATLILLSQTLHVARLLDNHFFNLIAKLSFGVYLWHVFIIEIIARKFESSFVYFGVRNIGVWALISSVVVIASFAIASISWRYMESPLLAKARRGEVKQY